MIKSMKNIGIVMMAGVFGIAVLANITTPASASSKSHSAIIKYKQGQRAYLYVCHSYTGDDKSNPCPNGGANKKNLPKGKDTNSYFGWEDCDGFYLPDGYDAYTVGLLNGHHFTSSGWKKIRGNNRHVVNVTLVADGQ